MAVPETTRSTPPALSERVVQLCRRLLVSDDRRQRRIVLLATIALVLAIGVIDFLLGFEISLLVFYCLPVVLATTLGWRFGLLTAGASVITWVVGDIVAGADYASRLVPWWNAAIALGTYFVVVWLFHIVQTLHREMEARVRERTAALSAEIRERERLEREVLQTTERERRLIGHDLHDGLGQHLTGTAFAGQVLGEKLQARKLPEEEADAWKLVQLVEEAIEKTRRLAKGLLLAEIQRDGLVTALQELAQTTSAEFRVKCTFQSDGDCDVPEAGAATHLLRIAQEAVRNAIRHGSAHHIELALHGTTSSLELVIRDDGKGIPTSAARGGGLGLRIMAHRAQIIGGDFAVARGPNVGTVVICHLPRSQRHD